MKSLNARQLQARLSDSTQPVPVLLDVREPAEFAICKIPGALLMPMHTVPARLQELERAAEIVVICHHGGRSARVAMFLEQQGFSNTINLEGGVSGWASDVDPSMPRY
jgi:rhodanese-related sulfurtransferase